jgi:predicted dehydrogenase
MRHLSCLFLLIATFAASAGAADPMRVGVIGLDTSHAIAFTQIFNDDKAEGDLAGFRVVAAYPKGSPDIHDSVSRVPEYTKKMQEMGVEIVDSIDALLERVDVVMLETNDGRPHLEQARPVIAAGKPLYIDKPLAGSLADCVAIFELARRKGVPVFSSSSLRFVPGAQEIRGGKLGRVFGADAYSPCKLEPTHPDLFWYGIHGVELLYTVMGTGCDTVERTTTKDTDVVVGTWTDGRIGTFRGTRTGKHGYGGTVFAEKGTAPIGEFTGYKPLVIEIARFFRTGKPPVDEAETLEIYAFMTAADESKRRGGEPVKIADVLEAARKQAK